MFTTKSAFCRLLFFIFVKKRIMAKVYYDLSKKGKDATGQLELRIRFTEGKSIDLKSGSRIWIEPDRWNNEDKVITLPFAKTPNLPDSLKKQNKYEELIKKKNDLTKWLIETAKTTNKDDINKAWLDEMIDRFHFPDKYIVKEEKVTFVSFVTDFIANAHKRIHDGKIIDKKTPIQYKIAFDYFLKFCEHKKKEYDFTDITKDDFYDPFEEFLTEKGLAKSTIGAKMKNIKLFMKTSAKFHNNKEYESFKVTKEPGDEIALTEEERDTIYNLDLSNTPHLDRVRDWFILLCCCGCRYSDLLNIAKWNREGDLFIFNQEKTDEDAYIPIHWMVEAILQKYDGTIPTPISNQKFNEALKEVAKLAELNNVETKHRTKGGKKVSKNLFRWQRVSSHTGRRTFATIEYRNNTPIRSIMAVTGHKTEESLLNYIKIDQKEHAKRLMDSWKKQREDDRIKEIIKSLSEDDRKKLLGL